MSLADDRYRLINTLVVHFGMFRDKAEAAADLFLHHKTLTPQPGEWQPIETAPKDGTLVMLCKYPHPGFLECPRKVGGWWDDKWNILGGTWLPTHWQPLPPPPR